MEICVDKCQPVPFITQPIPMPTMQEWVPPWWWGYSRMTKLILGHIGTRAATGCGSQSLEQITKDHSLLQSRLMQG